MNIPERSFMAVPVSLSSSPILSLPSETLTELSRLTKGHPGDLAKYATTLMLSGNQKIPPGGLSTLEALYKRQIKESPDRYTQVSNQVYAQLGRGSQTILVKPAPGQEILERGKLVSPPPVSVPSKPSPKMEPSKTIPPSISEILKDGSVQVVSFDKNGKRQGGTGIVLSRNGLMLTAAHVINGSSGRIDIIQDGKIFPGNIVKVDPKKDLALIKVESGSWRPIRLTQSSELKKEGNLIYATGHVGGALNERLLAGTFIAEVNRRDKGQVNYFKIPVRPGDSGGPIINEKGELLSMTTAIPFNPKQPKKELNQAIGPDIRVIKNFLAGIPLS
jgi:S1-C subfamily serine protease